jgi:hypothetical protein
MNRFTISVLIALVTIFGMGNTSFANLILNGDFELQQYVSSGKWTQKSSIPGWSIFEGDSVFEIQNNLYGENSQYLELAPNKPVGIMQTIDTVIGAKYILSFDYSPRPDAPYDNNGLIVGFAQPLSSNSIGTLNQIASLHNGNNAGWSHFSYSFNALSDHTAIVFAASNMLASKAPSYGPLLDNVSVESAPIPNPEPGTMLLMGIGVAGAIFMRRRAKRS